MPSSPRTIQGMKNWPLGGRGGEESEESRTTSVLRFGGGLGLGVGGANLMLNCKEEEEEEAIGRRERIGWRK